MKSDAVHQRRITALPSPIVDVQPVVISCVPQSLYEVCVVMGVNSFGHTGVGDNHLLGFVEKDEMQTKLAVGTKKN